MEDDCLEADEVAAGACRLTNPSADQTLVALATRLRARRNAFALARRRISDFDMK